MKKTLLPSFFVASLILFAATSIAQLPVQSRSDQKTLLQSGDPQLAQNKKLLYDFWREVFEAGHLELADKYMAETYIQHNPNVPTGRKAFVDFFSKFKKPEPIADTIKAPVVAIIAEGDMVVISFARELCIQTMLQKNIQPHGSTCSALRTARSRNIGTLRRSSDNS